jgi:hypothetical protein
MHVPGRVDVTIDEVIENDAYTPKEKYRWWEERTYAIMSPEMAIHHTNFPTLPKPDESDKIIQTVLLDYFHDKRNLKETVDKLLTDWKNLWGTERPA